MIDLVHAFKSIPLGQIMACNARDGAHIGLHDNNLVSEIFDTARARWDTLEPTRQTLPEFIACVMDVCYGPAGPWRPGSPYLVTCRCGISDLGGVWVSTVVTAATLVRLASKTDRDRFKAKGIILPPSGLPTSPVSWAERLGALEKTERYFRLDPIESHGNPVVWIVPRNRMEILINNHMSQIEGLADAARDLLGLIHHKPPICLFVLHFPARLVMYAGNCRPTFVEAGAHARFMAQSSNPTSDPSDWWGQAVDLEALLHTGMIDDGGMERVSRRLPPEWFQPDERVEFDFLGEVRKPRGSTAGKDEDLDFARQLLKRGPIDDFVAEVLTGAKSAL